MFVLYNILITILSPIWVPWMLYRTWKRKEAPKWNERTGDYELKLPADVPRIWIHAVSVGEVIAALPIIRAIRQKRPNVAILLSCTTSSGHQTARDQAAELVDQIVYFPIDIARFQLAAASRVQASVTAVMETELWLNFMWAAHVVNSKTLLINGRISDKSYPRSLRLRFFYKYLLRYLDKALMQTQKDADRIASLGAASVAVLGNCKFDQARDETTNEPLLSREELGVHPLDKVIVIGSTRGEDEEQFVLEALSKIEAKGLSIIHAPRHIERARALFGSVRKYFNSVALRSEKQHGSYLILDTYGELSRIYQLADVVIVGGGFGRYGGQNLLQPLAHGKPVLHGPNMNNFRQAAEESVRVGASKVCSTPTELTKALQSLLDSSDMRDEMGRAARQLIDLHVGASERYADAILDVLDEV